MALQYLDQVVRQAVYIERLKSQQAKDFDKVMKAVDEYLAKNVFNLDLSTLTKRQLNAKLAKITKDLTEIYAGFGDEFKDTLGEVYKYQYAHEAQSLVNAYPLLAEAGLVSATATAATVDAMLDTPLLLDGKRGKLLGGLLDKFATSEAEAVSEMLRASHFNGESVAQVVKKIRGTKAAGYSDGMLAITKRHAVAIARTGIQHSAINARQQFGNDNSDFIEGKQFIAVLDGRTTKGCMARDKQIVPLDSPLNPPFHVGCRTSMIFILKEKYRGKNQDVAKYRRAGSERIDYEDSYFDWLKRQPESFQNDTLGVTRAKLLRDGGLSSKEFADLSLDKNFEPITLEEMKKKNPKIFEKIKDK